MIDNYDSFTYNLVQYLGELGADVDVRRNDADHARRGRRARARRASSSRPARARRREAGISVPLDPAVRRARSRSSASASATRHRRGASAATIVRAPRIMHGKTSPIHHDGAGVFARPARTRSTRPATTRWSSTARRCPPRSRSRAWTAEGEIMGVRHRDAAARGRAVPPRVDPDARGQAAARQLPRRVCPGGSRRREAA